MQSCEVPELKRAYNRRLIIETICFILTVLLFFGLSVFLLSRRMHNIKIKKTQAMLEEVNKNILIFQSIAGEYPNSILDLVQKPQGTRNWRILLDKEPVDAWGYKFVYRHTPEGEYPYELYSYGGRKGEKEAKENRIDIWNI